MSTDNETPVTPSSNVQAPTNEAQTPSTEGTQQVQPDKLGSQFAALGRKEKALRQQEQSLRAKEEQLTASLKQVQELESLSADEILERIAQRKGSKPEDLIQSWINKSTGAKTAEKALEESKDPAVQALQSRIKDQEKAYNELKARLEAKETQAQEAQAKAAVELVQNECLQSATTAWTDESDYPLFFSDQQDLASQVLTYCRERVTQYRAENGFPPEDTDIAALIKAAPQLLIDNLLKSPRGQRLASLKQAQQAAPVRTSGVKPRLTPSTTSTPRAESPDRTTNTVRTKLDHSERLARAKNSIPSGARFPGL
jgi:hypothetical protein